MNNAEQNSSRPSSGKLALSLAALAAYPAAIHLCILQDRLTLALLVVILPYLFLMNLGWTTRVITGLVLMGGLVALHRLPGENTQLLLYLLPIAINTALAALFGTTLRPGHTPLITRYARALGAPENPRVDDYTRAVTWIWTSLFLLMATESLLLARFASIELWSLFVNVLNYAFVACVFIAEYLFRRYWLSQFEHPGFLRFIGELTRTPIRNARNPQL